VLCADASGEALAGARGHLERNGFATREAECIEGNAFAVLRELHAAGRRCEVIIVDPPKLVPSARHLERASRAYKDVNRVALQCLTRLGTLATFSCSGLLEPELFQRIVQAASVAARRDPRIVERLAQPPDHPVRLAFPEGEYLKGLICRDW